MLKKYLCIFIISSLLAACSTRDQDSAQLKLVNSNGQQINDVSENPWGEDKFYGNRSPSSFKGLEVEEFIDYKIKENDTLMLISFATYGDYARWREIIKNNPVKANELVIGDTLRLVKPNSPTIFYPKGLPYIVQQGDTLGKISDDKYGTPRKWRKIYNNNKTLIKNPNIIFAGFTIFYEPEEKNIAL